MSSNSVEDLKSPPIIDISPLFESHTSKERDEVIHQIGQACTHWGFFHIINHGIPQSLIDQHWSQMVHFFKLPQEIKNSIRRDSKNSRGYFDHELTKQKLDLKSGFDYGHQDSGIDGKSRWPQNQPEFKDSMMEYFGKMSEVSEILLDSIAESLGVQKMRFRSYFSENHTSFLRLNYYPPNSLNTTNSPTPTMGLGIHPHKDAGVLTIIRQDDQVPGLQVYIGNSTGMALDDPGWILITPVKGALTVNIGDMMQVWSNDHYKAPLHRVLAPTGELPRYSAAFFYNPRYDTDVVPIVGGEDPHYQTVNWGEFRGKRYAGDYADLGEEVQIEHYLIKGKK